MEQQIPQVILDELKSRFLGKRIRVPDTNKYTGFGIEGGHIEGICEFIGINPNIPSWGLQVTIGRLPITDVKINSISLIEDRNVEL
jgi:hypothetical protein